jgi:serine/threonine protein kinase
MEVSDYIIKKNKLGHGSFGDVFQGNHKTTNEKVAVKIETTDQKKILKHEYSVYKALHANPAAPHIPKIHFFGVKDGETILIMEFLNASIEKLHTKCGKTFTLKTTLMLGIQMFDLLKKLHESNFVHRDIKPDNFLLGNEDKTRIYLIDFGLTKRFKNENNVHVKFQEGKSLVGTARYASINSHAGFELSRRDDLESLFYMLIYLWAGTLPWQGIEAPTREEKYVLIGDKKKTVSEEELCNGLPPAFCTCLKYIKNLKFKDKPDYPYLRAQLTDTFRAQGFHYDCKYDWIGG